jgi:hypothetical protein
MTTTGISGLTALSDLASCIPSDAFRLEAQVLEV